MPRAGAARLALSARGVGVASGSERVLRAGRIAWALLGVLAVLAVLAVVAARFSLVVVTFVIALFPAALLSPAAEALKRRGMPGALASLVVLAGFFGLVAALVRLTVPQVRQEVPDLVDQASKGLGRLQSYLRDSPLPYEPGQLEQAAREVGQRLLDRQSAMAVATAVVDVLSALALGLVLVFFVLKDGARLWHGVTDLVPRGPRDFVERAGRQVWTTLGSYVRGQLLIAAVDAVFIGLGLLLLGVPLVVPLAVLVFVGGLFPIVGAFVSGLAAVLVALATEGVVTALLVLGLVIAVQQAEGNLLEPLVLGRATALHPLVVVLSIAAGAVAFGVLGAFLAVPLVASVARVVDLARGREPGGGS
jgi:predicted PurR-regulated permease PerM